MLRIKVSEEDIKNIKDKGYSDFIDKDIENNKFIKMINGFCYFLELDKGITSCKIYSIRPDGCRKYPFFNEVMMECPALDKKFQ